MKQFLHTRQHQIGNTAKIFLVLCLFACVSIPRFHLLYAHWSSDEARWLHRSAQFMSAIKEREFSETLIAYHPGVTTMWIAGLRTLFTPPRIDVENLASARLFIGIVVWAGIGIASFLLYKLFGQWVALSGFVGLAYSPLFLAQTRRVHTDALAATFIFLTVLLFLIYCQKRQHCRYLIISGIAFGLALLSKSYALILLPWIPFCLFLFQERCSGNFWTYFAEGICFLNCAVLIILAVWPVFWTPFFGLMAFCLVGLTMVLFRSKKNKHIPLERIVPAAVGLILVCVQAAQHIWLVFDKVNWAITTPHEVEHFFLGKVVYDPGWLFYPFVLIIKSTPLMLPLATCGVLLLWKQQKQSEDTSRHFRTVLSFVACLILFTVCLSVTSKKFSRYLLPAFPMLEILSAIGFIQGLKWVYNALLSRFGAKETAKYKAILAGIACLAFFFIQMVPVLALHPYYGTYYNLSWKVTDITRIITVGEASGLDIAAKYLNDKPDAHKLVVQVSPLATEFVYHYFQGRVYRADRITKLSPDYEVVYIRDSQIGRVPQTGTLNGELEAVITLNGIDHVWIYRIEKP